MSKPLTGKKIVLAASRKVEEMSTLIEKQGGEVLVRSMQGTIYVAEESSINELKSVIEQGVDWFVLTTGIGTNKLLELARGAGLEEELIQLLKETKIAARGYKTKNALKELGITPTISDDDGTTNGLIRALSEMDFKYKRVALQLHGVSSPNLTEFFHQKEATLSEILPYRHIAPKEEDVKLLYKEVMNHEIDAVCFTTILQVRALYEYAKQRNKNQQLTACFNEQVIAVAVGKVTLEGLTDQQVTRFVVPQRERMGAMVVELAKYVQADC
ncbi:uroporphyrinogen-III synthase [Bacillus sp. FJAT-45037]|uniref:uroporphyrinogen-III synthase n=1 Tax=Bacillus sp. FJAT-45037 TaxID=2011007 RepID=UPI000C24298D|nr:uroporphyrinogen-III synthase [Bacillus sp. FJAT-45037]